MSTERLQKILAQAGIASRRKAEELIELGLVTVNGKAAKLGDKADIMVDHIKIDGKLIQKPENLVYLTFYKPRGVISQLSDPEGRPTIADYLTKLKFRVFPIGRLDYNSEGVLLLTNDGEIAEKIQKAIFFPRVYHVKIKGHVTAEMIERLKRGMRMNSKSVKPHSVRLSDEYNKKSLVEIVFLNTPSLDVKSYFEQKGFLVEKLTRTGFGHITLSGLKPGDYKIVNKTKFDALLAQPELGVRDLERRIDKERELLPTDLRSKRNAIRDITPAAPGSSDRKSPLSKALALGNKTRSPLRPASGRLGEKRPRTGASSSQAITVVKRKRT